MLLLIEGPIIRGLVPPRRLPTAIHGSSLAARQQRHASTCVPACRGGGSHAGGSAARPALLSPHSASAYSASDAASCLPCALSTSTLPTATTTSMAPSLPHGSRHAHAAGEGSGGTQPGASATAGGMGAGGSVACELCQEGLESGHVVMIMAAVMVSHQRGPRSLMLALLACPLLRVATDGVRLA